MNQLDREVQDWPPEVIQSIKAPTLLIIGDSNVVRPKHTVELFRLLGGVVAGDLVGLPRSQLAVLPGTTHVTPESIGYTTFGFRLFTPWENVEGRGTRIEVRSIGRGMSTNHVVSGLRLRQSAPVFQVRPWVRFMLAEIRDDPSRFIPISDVVADWSTSELADEIRRYAPMGLRDM